jgi:transcription initiation factor TFIID subunit 6
MSTLNLMYTPFNLRLLQLHQLMPSLLTCLIAKRLGNQTKSSSKEAYALRDFSASLLQLIIDRFSSSYSTLKPRITRALLKAYLDNKKPLTTHYGAITGLRIMGAEVVRALVVPNLKIYSEFVLQPAFDAETDVSQKFDAEKCLEAIMVVSL